jgi:hypothetical protein
MHEQIPQLGRIEHVRVIECGERGHSESLERTGKVPHHSEPQFLVVGGEIGEDCPALGIRASLVGHQRFEADAAVRTDAAIFDLALVEKLNQRRARDVQHVRRFLSGEFGLYGDECHRVAPRHFLKNVNEHPHC